MLWIICYVSTVAICLYHVFVLRAYVSKHGSVMPYGITAGDIVGLILFALVPIFNLIAFSILFYNKESYYAFLFDGTDDKQ